MSTNQEQMAVANIATMNQLPTSDKPRAESPLYHADLATLAAKGNQEGGVTLKEHACLDHLVIRGNVDDAAFMQGCEQVLSTALPSTLQSVESNEVTVYWVSPDEWLAIMPNGRGFELENELRTAIGDTHFALVNVSGGQTLLSLSGKHAEDVLKKTTAYDVHESHMPIGKVVTSTFSKTQAIICRTGENSFDIVVRRSFADYAWAWLQDASAEFGLVIAA